MLDRFLCAVLSEADEDEGADEGAVPGIVPPGSGSQLRSAPPPSGSLCPAANIASALGTLRIGGPGHSNSRRSSAVADRDAADGGPAAAAPLVPLNSSAAASPPATAVAVAPPPLQQRPPSSPAALAVPPTVLVPEPVVERRGVGAAAESGAPSSAAPRTTASPLLPSIPEALEWEEQQEQQAPAAAQPAVAPAAGKESSGAAGSPALAPAAALHSCAAANAGHLPSLQPCKPAATTAAGAELRAGTRGGSQSTSSRAAAAEPAPHPARLRGPRPSPRSAPARLPAALPADGGAAEAPAFAAAELVHLPCTVSPLSRLAVFQLAVLASGLERAGGPVAADSRGLRAAQYRRPFCQPRRPVQALADADLVRLQQGRPPQKQTHCLSKVLPCAARLNGRDLVAVAQSLVGREAVCALRRCGDMWMPLADGACRGARSRSSDSPP